MVALFCLETLIKTFKLTSKLLGKLVLLSVLPWSLLLLRVSLQHGTGTYFKFNNAQIVHLYFIHLSTFIPNRSLLSKFGGHIELSRTWAVSILRRMGFVQRRGSTQTKAKLSDEQISKLKHTYLAQISGMVKLP